MPWCFGATLGSMSINTTNDNWETEFVTEKVITKKCIKLQNFAMFINFKKEIFYDKMTEEKVDLNTLDPKLLELIMGESEVEPP